MESSAEYFSEVAKNSLSIDLEFQERLTLEWSAGYVSEVVENSPSVTPEFWVQLTFDVTVKVCGQ